MKKKFLNLSIILVTVLMLTTPFIGSTLALGKPCKGGETESFTVNLAVDPAFYILNTESRYVPSETNPKLAYFTTPEYMVDYTITVGEDVYTLADFDYIGTMFSVVHKPNMTEYAGVFTPGEKMTWKWLYLYDFSAVQGGLEGAIYIYAEYKLKAGVPVSSKIFSLWGTGDFSCTQINAIIDMSVGHIGTVTGWPEPPAS